MTSKEIEYKIKSTLYNSISQYKGIPSPKDFISYNVLYYQSVKDWTVKLFGHKATFVDVMKTMYFHGNVLYFRWFPDLFHHDREKLGKFFNPIFRPIEDNEFADYLHNLTHIRSESSHTNLGEALALSDNFINNKVKFQLFLKQYEETPLDEIERTPSDIFGQSSEIKKILGEKKALLFEIIKETWIYQKPDMIFYQDIYKEQSFKKEFPQQKPNLDFLILPKNDFELRMRNNLFRAIYLDEKFKFYSTSKAYFSDTPIKQSINEHYLLLFTDMTERKFLKDISSEKLQNIQISANNYDLPSDLIQSTIDRVVEVIDISSSHKK